MSVRDELKWDAAGLIPTVVQETATGEVLMVAWMDRTALEAALPALDADTMDAVRSVYEERIAPYVHQRW